MHGDSVCLLWRPAERIIGGLARGIEGGGRGMIVVMVPVAAPLLPGAELDAWTCCVPMANLALLIRALLTGPVASHLVLLTLYPRWRMPD